MRDLPAGLPGQELVSAGLADLAAGRESAPAVERCFKQDLADVRAMIETGLVEPQRLQELYEATEPRLYRFPAIDPPAFRRKLDAVLR